MAKSIEGKTNNPKFSETNTVTNVITFCKLNANYNALPFWRHTLMEEILPHLRCTKAYGLQ